MKYLFWTIWYSVCGIIAMYHNDKRTPFFMFLFGVFVGVIGQSILLDL